MRVAGVFLRMSNFRDRHRRFQNVTKSCSRVLSLLGDHSLSTGVGTGWLTNGCDGANGLSQAGGPKSFIRTSGNNMTAQNVLGVTAVWNFLQVRASGARLFCHRVGSIEELKRICQDSRT